MDLPRLNETEDESNVSRTPDSAREADGTVCRQGVESS